MRLTSSLASVQNISEGSSRIKISQQISWGYCCSVTFSHSVVSNSLQPHGRPHARPQYPSPTLRVYSNSCSLSWWCHPTISSSVIPFSSCPQSFPARGSFPMSLCWTKYWSFSFNITPSDEHSGYRNIPVGWIGWISLPYKGLSRVFSNTTVHSCCY